jgi:hypothetical protein
MVMYDVQSDLQSDRYDLNVKFLIFYKVHSVEVLSQDPSP